MVACPRSKSAWFMARGAHVMSDDLDVVWSSQTTDACHHSHQHPAAGALSPEATGLGLPRHCHLGLSCYLPRHCLPRYHASWQREGQGL